jgi:hypothetical protein
MRSSKSVFYVLALAGSLVASYGYGVTFDFTQDGNSAGSLGNTRTYALGGVTVTTTAWSYGLPGGPSNLASAALGTWSSGLGVINLDELYYHVPYDHQVDNNRGADYILFRFSEPVFLADVVVAPYGVWDSDVLYLSGMVAPGFSPAGKSFADLASLGFTPTLNLATASDAPRTVALDSLDPVNMLLLGVPLMGTPGTDVQVDKFMLSQLQVIPVIPEPSALALALLGCGALLLRRRA